MPIPNWSKIIEDVCVRLPNPRYLDFVESTLLGSKPVAQKIDPFAFEIPIPSTDYYVDRDEVERAILLPGTRIILGKYGTGKTTLFKKLSDDLLGGKETLVVKILLNEGYIQPDSQSKMQEKSPICVENLVHLIFNAYWEDFILPSSQTQLRTDDTRQKYLPWFRREQRWMRLLSWFYHNFPPLHRTISDDFELMAWLEFSKSNDHLGSYIAPETTLRELIRLIFYETETKDLTGKPFGPRYHKVIILIDGSEALSSTTSRILLPDFQHFLDQKIPNVEILFFSEDSKSNLFENIECVQDGRVSIYELPAWTNLQLKKILALRRKACLSGAFSISDPWAMTLTLTSIQYSARDLLTDNLIMGSHPPEDKQHRFDAPIHLLKLTRGVIAACAGCWQESGLPLPISQENIDELIRAYWHHLLP